MRLVAMVLACWIFAAGAQEITYRGSGTSSCGRWLEMREDRRAGPMEGWVMGYLSAMSEARKVDLLREVDTRAVFAWMDVYCKENPLKPMLDGAQELARELRGR